MTNLQPGAASAGASHAPASGRLHGLDALRGLALMLGLLVHASLAFLPGAQYFWIAADPAPDRWLGLAFYVPHMFRMILFFMLAGYFGRLACERLGTKAFAWDRFRRITLVLVTFWPIVFSGIIVAIVIAAMHANGGSLPDTSPPGPAFTPDDFPLTHLWFLYVLTLCYVAMLAGRRLIAKLDKMGLLKRAADGLVRVLTTPFGPALLALPLAAALLVTPNWFIWFGIPTPDSSLYPNLAACIAFGSAFLLGWWLHRQSGLMARWTKHWPLHLAIAIAATIACLWLYDRSNGAAPAAPGLETNAYAFLYALGGWSWTVALTGLALRFCSGESPTRRYLADASYWIYIMHLPIVMILQAYAVQLPGPALLKFVAIIAITTGLLLLTYQWFVRRSFIGIFINGKKR